MSAGELWHAVEHATQTIFQMATGSLFPFSLILVVLPLVILFFTLGRFALEYQERLEARAGKNYAAQQSLKGTRPWKIANGVLSFSARGMLVSAIGMFVIFFYGALTVIGWLVFSLGRLLFSTYDRWWFIPVLLVLTWLLFVMRVKFLLLYGALEIAVGISIISSSIGNASSSISQEAAKSGQSAVILVIAVLGGVYVVIRGLDNVDKSITTLAGRMKKLHYIRLRILWECYVTRRMPSAQEAHMAALREWRSAEPKFPRNS